MIDVCPNCDSADIRVRTKGMRTEKPNAKHYYCDGCQQSFDEPDTREVNNTSHCRSGIAGKLANNGENKI